MYSTVYSVLSRAAVVRPSLAGTWRLLGEAASLLLPLPPSTVGQVQVPSCLLRAGGQGQEQVAKEQVLELAVRCYSRALALQPDSSGIWHEVRSF